MTNKQTQKEKRVKIFRAKNRTIFNLLGLGVCGFFLYRRIVFVIIYVLLKHLIFSNIWNWSHCPAELPKLLYIVNATSLLISISEKMLRFEQIWSIFTTTKKHPMCVYLCKTSNGLVSHGWIEELLLFDNEYFNDNWPFKLVGSMNTSIFRHQEECARVCFVFICPSFVITEWPRWGERQSTKKQHLTQEFFLFGIFGL